MIPKLPEKASMEFEKKLGLVFPDSEPEIKEIPKNKRPSDRKTIPVCWPSITDLEKEYVFRVVNDGWVSSLGPEVKKFEKEYAEKFGVKYAISCTNGTEALHLAVASLGVGPGDEVILPTFTMVASINSILYVGATPVLVDADGRLNIDVRQIEQKITKNTKAIMPVHIYGYPCNMDEIMRIAKKYNLRVIEDVAESHGALYKGKITGSIGDVGCYSFYANKIVTCGEGGMLTTNNKELAERIRTLMNHAFSPERHFCHRFIGYNCRMTAMQAALGRAQLKRFDEILEKKEQLRSRYIQNLSISPRIFIPNQVPEEGIKPVCWMFGVQIIENCFPVKGDIKNKVRNLLAKKGIETRNFFVPMHLQPIQYKRFGGQRYPASERLMESGFYLPSAVDLNGDEIDYVCEHLVNIVEGIKI